MQNFREGDVTDAFIVSIDTEKQRISLSLKPSYLVPDLPTSPGDEYNAIPDSSQMSEHREEKDVDDESASRESGIHQDEEAVSIDLSSWNAVSRPANRPKSGAIAPSLELSGGFQWSNFISDGESDEESWSSNHESDNDDEIKSERQRKKQIEYDLTADMQSKKPESTADFERLLLGSPNSSYLWIQYMSFQLQLSEIEKAREIGRRAIQAINIREELEKLNVWVALLNLENTYGSEESLELVFKEAVRRNDSKTIHLKLAAIFDQSNKAEVCFISIF